MLGDRILKYISVKYFKKYLNKISAKHLHII